MPGGLERGPSLKRHTLIDHDDELAVFKKAARRMLLTMVVTDTEGNILYVNPHFTKATGYSAEEVLGQNPRILKSGVHPPGFYTALWGALKAGKDWRGEFVNKRRDGSLFNERTLIFPAQDKNGATRYYVSLKEDVTEAVRKDKRLSNLKDALKSRTDELLRELKTKKVPPVSGQEEPVFPGALALIVDDDTLSRKLLAKLLTANGYNVCQATDGREGVRIFSERKPDIVFMDCNMPVMDGFQACSAIKGSPGGADTPLIMVTGMEDQESVRKAFEAGAGDYITKPFHWEPLKVRMETLLRQKKAAQSLQADSGLVQERIDELQHEMEMKTTVVFDSRPKAYIASNSRILSHFISLSCKNNNVDYMMMRNERDILREMEEARPDIIFIQAGIIETMGEGFVSRIKSNETLTDAFIVIHTSKERGAEFAFNCGADFFLPIPFSKRRVDTIFRQALNLPKKILITGASHEGILPLYQELISRKFETLCAETGNAAVKMAVDMMPDAILCQRKLPDMTGPELCRRIKQDEMLSHIAVIIQLDNDSHDTEKDCFDAGASESIPPGTDPGREIEMVLSVVAAPKRGKKDKVMLAVEDINIRGSLSKTLKQNGFIVFSSGSEESLKNILEKEAFDIIIADFSNSSFSPEQFCRRVRKEGLSKTAPLLITASRESEESAKRLGKSLSNCDFILKPFSGRDLVSLVKKAIESQRLEKERKELARYVPADAVKHIDDALSGVKSRAVESKFISILFADICAFTRKCESLAPDDVVSLLNRYFDICSEVIEKNNGIIDKFIGDAIVARFDSGSKEQDAHNAVNAARAMLKALDKFNAGPGAASPVRIRIGVNSGEVVLGNIGSSRHRLDYTMIGDNVNVCQRLETNAPEQGCLISEDTWRLTRDPNTGETQYFQVKGRLKPVPGRVLLA